MDLSSLLVGFVLSIVLLLCICKSHAQTQVFNIMQFGAKSDGVTDSRQALSMAWSRACAYKGTGVVFIPHGKFLVLPLMLAGPGNGFTQLQIDGQLLAPSGESFATGDYWLAIHRVNNLVVDGQGLLDGRGPSAWSLTPACTNDVLCSDLPISLRFHAVNTATIRNIKSVNSKFFHLMVFESRDITFDHITIIAPEKSPNTDGIHVSMSTGINIMNSMIGTGDDCISLGPGSINVNITNVNCGPGHGISIGSLGKHSHEANVTGITVRDCIFTNTKNGVRIKSWSTPFFSVVDKIEFINLQMNNVRNPITIDQNYCPHDSFSHKEQSMSRVHIQNVRYEGIRGTSTSQVAVDLYCSHVAPCQSIVLQDINLSLNGGGSTVSICQNVSGSTFGQQLPPSCL